MADKIPRSTTLASDPVMAITSTVFLRPGRGSDEPLCERIFAESHCAGFDLLGLEPASLNSLIRMQFQARQAQYRLRQGAIEYLICRGADQDTLPLGSCWLLDSAEELRLLDIAVLVEHRRRGLARAVLTGLCAQAAAASKPVRLSVWRENVAARQLYRTLGFLPDPAVGGGDEEQHGEPGDLGNGYLELLYVHRDIHSSDQDAPAAAAAQPAGSR
jgi:ribosomal protein S18 acetylase RimI-like enzyme